MKRKICFEKLIDKSKLPHLMKNKEYLQKMVTDFMIL